MQSKGITLLILAVLSVLVLFFFGKRYQPISVSNSNPTSISASAPAQTAPTEQLPRATLNFDALSKRLLPKIDKINANTIEAYNLKLSNTTQVEEQKIYLDTLASNWYRSRYIEIAAHYREEIARIDSTEQNWERAAIELATAHQIAKDSTMRAYLKNHAYNAYYNVLQLNPDNNMAKTELAGLRIEAFGNQPSQVMKGIFDLREVLEDNPNNSRAIMLLGKASITSAQYDKAIERFEKLTTIEPQNGEAWLYLGEAYAALGKNNSAINALQNSKKLAKSSIFADQLDLRIEQLRKETP